MAKVGKIVDKMRRQPLNIRFAELHKVLQAYGFKPTKKKSGSSHVIFRHGSGVHQSVPKDNPVNIAYVVKVLELIDSGLYKLKEG